MVGDISNLNVVAGDDFSSFDLKSVTPVDCELIDFDGVLCDDSGFGGDIEIVVVDFDFLNSDLGLHNE